MKRFALLILPLLSGCSIDDAYHRDYLYSKNERTCSGYGFVYGTSAFSKCMMDLENPKQQQQNVIIHNNNSVNTNKDFIASQDRSTERKLMTELETARLQKERAEIEKERIKNESERYKQEQARAYQEKNLLNSET